VIGSNKGLPWNYVGKPIDLRTVYPHGESADVSAAAVAPVEGVQRLVQSGGQRQKPYVCAISSRRWKSAGPGALWLAIVTGRPISRKNRPNRIGTTKFVCNEHVSADGAVAQAGLISAAVLGVTGLIGSTIGGVIADCFLFELSQFL
jgi:hypothetical protein